MTLMLERKSPCSRGWTIIQGNGVFPDGSLVTSIGWDKRVQEKESQTGHISHVLTGHKQGVALQLFPMTENPFAPPAPMERFALALEPAGKWFISRLRVWVRINSVFRDNHYYSFLAVSKPGPCVFQA